MSIKNNHLDELSKYHMRDIRALHIDQWWKGLRAKGLSPHYLNDILSWVKRFFTEAQALDIIEKVPRFPGAVTQPETVPEWLTQTEQNQIFAYIPRQDRPIFDFMFLTGVRVNEATALQREDIDFGKRTVSIQRTIRRDGSLGPTQARKTRTIIMSQAVKDCLINAMKVASLHGSVFMNRWSRRYSDDYLRDTFKRACVKADIKPIHLKNATRHSFGMRFIEQGMDIWTVSKWMGHADIKMTERYVQAVLEDGERVYSRG